MTTYNKKGEGFGTTQGKGAPMGGKFQVANEAKMAKANRSTKAKIGKAPAEVAKTKRSVANKTHNAGFAGTNRTVLKADLKKAL